MAHHVYNTEGFVIESNPSGEANKSYYIFTKELGMVRATAQGVRLLKSKLRFSLQDYSYARVSVVRGKDIWRITNAKAEWNLFSLYKEHKQSRYVVAHVFSLLKRLIPGEEQHEQLFCMLFDSFSFLETLVLPTEQDLGAFERIVVLSMLHHLGYIGNALPLQEFIEPQWNTELLDHMKLRQKMATQEINRALRESQL